MRRCGLAGLALTLLLGGGVRADEKEADKAEAAKKAWKSLNGTWVLVSSVTNGGREGPPKDRTALTLKDGKYTLRAGGMVVDEGTAKIDPSARPKSLDITPATGPDKGKTLVGIYEVKGETLRLCFAPPGKPRPKALESRKGSGHTLDTYKRAKARD